MPAVNSVRSRYLAFPGEPEEVTRKYQSRNMIATACLGYCWGVTSSGCGGVPRVASGEGIEEWEIPWSLKGERY